MPGTVGSIWGVAIVLPLSVLSTSAYVAWTFLLTLLAIPVCGMAEKSLRKKDDRRIVADEFMTFPICMIGLPVSLEFWWVLPMAFVTNRFFDIVKFPPARQLEQVEGGAGIVLDDAAAAVYSLVLNHALFRVVLWLDILP